MEEHHQTKEELAIVSVRLHLAVPGVNLEIHVCQIHVWMVAHHQIKTEFAIANARHPIVVRDANLETHVHQTLVWMEAHHPIKEDHVIVNVHKDILEVVARIVMVLKMAFLYIGILDYVFIFK